MVRMTPEPKTGVFARLKGVLFGSRRAQHAVGARHRLRGDGRHLAALDRTVDAPDWNAPIRGFSWPGHGYGKTASTTGGAAARDWNVRPNRVRTCSVSRGLDKLPAIANGTRPLGIWIGTDRAYNKRRSRR